MAAKYKYSVVHDGQTFTRTTERTYTHIVVYYSVYRECYEASWCGSYELAQKQMSRHVTCNDGATIVPIIDSNIEICVCTKNRLSAYWSES